MELSWIILILGLSFTADASDWTYRGETGPIYWADLFPEACAGASQSPIDIRTEETVFNPGLKQFAIFHDPPRPGSKFIAHNNGHAIQVDVEGEFFVSNAGLPSIYRTAQYHFHWGHKSHHGSEHTVNGAAAPIEMHVVNWNTDYATIVDAVVQPGGLAVLGILFEISEHDNPAFEPLVEVLTHVRDPDKKMRTEIPAVGIREYLPRNPERYYRYNGSLTTPGCFESVIWSVFHEKQTISRRQLQVFRQVLRPKHKKHHRRHLDKRSLAHRMQKAEESVLQELGIQDDRAQTARLKRNLEGQAAADAENKTTVTVVSSEDKPNHEHGSHSGHHGNNNGGSGHHMEEPASASVDHVNYDTMPDPSKSMETETAFLDRMLVNNYRPVQPLNGRVVYRSFPFFVEPVQPEPDVPQPVPPKQQPQPCYDAPQKSTDQHGAGNSVFISISTLLCSLVCLLVFN